MRADALLSRYGYCSRREAAVWLKQGRLSDNGVVISSPSARVQEDRALVNGEPVPFPHGLYIAFHKPVGYTCTHAEEDGTPVYDLLPEQWRRRTPEVQSVGRLDKETSGILLFTDDGKLLHRLTSPRQHVLKTYAFCTLNPVPIEAVALFAGGEMMLRGEKTPCLPAQLELTSPCEGMLTLREGRYHQVRRMLAAVGAPVKSLKRVSIGPLSLDALGLAPGEWTEFNPALFVHEA